VGDKDDRARGELITLVEAIGFYDGLSFGLSVVRQFFKLYNLSLPKLDLGSRTIPTVIKEPRRGLLIFITNCRSVMAQTDRLH
jgi:hypothetical protein